MKPNGLKQSRLLIFICLLGLFLFFTMGCRGKVSSDEGQAKAPEKSELNEPKVIEIVTSQETLKEDLKKVFSSEIPPQQAVSKVKGHVIAMLPYASTKNRDKLNEIVKYLDGVEKSPDEYFDDMNNLVELMQTMTQGMIIATEIEPDNFDVNYPLAYSYLTTASSVDNFLDPSEEHKRLSAEYKQKALQAAKALVKKFPDEAKAYHQLGFFTEIVEGDSEKALKLFKRCVEIDPELEMCQKAYDATREELEN
jgi:tetratricopeptide (TPR) repeat protein